ncbi:MAG: hypothetical protein GF315_14375 [candidate division Zixibacteria bacterium]|nr:hypothetical protein [candidate division Zixibacteria bacterium]
MSAKKDIETNRNSNDNAVAWVNHPAAVSRKRTLIVSIFLLIIFATVYLTTHSPLLTVVAVIIMVGSLSSFYVPTKYTMNQDGVEIRSFSGIKTYNWSRFRSFYPDSNGVFLSPFVKPSRLENFRGVYLRFSDNRDEVMDFVTAMISKDDPKDGGENVSS